MTTNMDGFIQAIIIIMCLLLVYYNIRVIGVSLFEKNIDTITDKKIADDEIKEFNKTVQTYFDEGKEKRKPDIYSTSCKYCGSRNIKDFTCNQCGAPVR